jgi:predicted nucleotidyltransferase component of viral defense system
MEYDLEHLSKTLGFGIKEIEKVLRISDVLEDISNVRFLQDHLSLYGGTALNFIYLEDISRLSIDIDFNYRHKDVRDWGEVRRDVEDRIKRLLKMRGYENIRINPSYPLCRMDISYVNSSGLNDSFLIEIGYMRRYSILKEDILAGFMHIGKKERFGIKTPKKEELFANKVGVCLYRTTARDIYDVYRIAGQEFDVDTFRKCLVMDSLMRGRPPLNEIEISEVIGRVPIDSGLRNLLRTGVREDFEKIKEKVIRFGERIVADLTGEEIRLIHDFYTRKEFRPESIDDRRVFHPELQRNPAIRWALKK